MDITPDKVLEIQQYAREPISLDQTIGDEGDSQLGDFIEDSEAVVAVDAVSFTLLQDQLQSVLQTLSEREAGVVTAALRAHRRPAAHPGRDRPGLRRHPRADPADRVQDDVQAAPPVALAGAARLPGLTGMRPRGGRCPPRQGVPSCFPRLDRNHRFPSDEADTLCETRLELTYFVRNSDGPWIRRCLVCTTTNTPMKIPAITNAARCPTADTSSRVSPDSRLGAIAANDSAANTLAAVPPSCAHRVSLPAAPSDDRGGLRALRCSPRPTPARGPRGVVERGSGRAGCRAGRRARRRGG